MSEEPQAVYSHEFGRQDSVSAERDVRVPCDTWSHCTKSLLS